MFPSGYFLVRYYPGRYYPKAGGPPGVGGGYYPGRYFAQRYFAQRYFPAAANPTPTPAAGLIEALAAFLASDPAVFAAFPGGWSNGDADRDTRMPFGVFFKVGTKRKASIKAGYSVDKVAVHFLCEGTNAETAEAAARTLKARLLASQSYTPPALVFADGSEAGGSLGRYLDTSEGGELTALDPERSSMNNDVWHAVVPVVFKVARGG